MGHATRKDNKYICKRRKTMKFCSCGAFLELEGDTYVCYKCGHTELATEMINVYTQKRNKADVQIFVKREDKNAEKGVAITCPQCSHREAKVDMVSTGIGRGEMVTRYTCKKCGHAWR